jgi:hypothetical protein
MARRWTSENKRATVPEKMGKEAAVSDPQMPKRMPPEVERELQAVLQYRDRPNPIDVYNAIRDVLGNHVAERAGHKDVPPAETN